MTDQLKQLSEAATQGDWTQEGRNLYADARINSEDNVNGFLGLVSPHHENDWISLRDAEFICALVNAYRAGELVPAEEARAREAVAYEVAAKMAQGCGLIIAPESVSQRVGAESVKGQIATCIRTLTAADTTAALEQIKQEVDKAGFERGVREAAEICRKHTYQPPNTFLNHCTMRKAHREDIAAAILAILATLSEPKGSNISDDFLNAK